MKRAAAAALVVAACGRLDFDPIGGPSDAGSIAWVGTFVTNSTAGDFTTHAHSAGDAILVHIECESTAQPSSSSVSAPGWTFVELAPIRGINTRWVNSFGAIAPDTNPATFTVTWATSCTGGDELGDEFANADPTGGTTTFEAAAHTAGPVDCAGSVTTRSANDTIWAACSSGGTMRTIDPAYTKASDDGNDDWSEYKITAAPPGSIETAIFTSASGGDYVMTMVAIKPR